MANEPKKIQIIDDASVRELYANKLVSASFDGGAVVITLGVTRFVPEDSTQAPAEGIRLPVHVTGRLAVSPSGAVELANALNNMLKTLRELQQKAATAKAS